MSEMIERVARAIAKEYSGIENYDWTAFEGEARVAIEAMRDHPTEEMIARGAEGLRNMYHGSYDEPFHLMAKAVLTAALSQDESK